MTFPKRGGFARDRRTGQYVRVTEEGRSGDWMVRTVYKSDGYWTLTENLEPARDPHAPAIRDMIRLVLVLGFTGWISWATYTDLTGYGVPGMHALVPAVPSGLSVLWGLAHLLDLHRP